MAYFGGCDEVFHGVRVLDGAEVMTLDAGAYTAASPAVTGSLAIFGTFDNDVLAIDVGTGALAWRYRHAEREFPYYSSAAVAEGRVFVGGRDKLVHALDAATGREIWTFQTRARVESSPAVVGGRVLVGSNDGRFYALDAASGREVWHFESGAPFSASPAVAAGRIVIGDEDGRIYCFG